MTQSQALSILKTGANVFLSGEPGSGKTHVINEYVKYLRDRNIEPAITASTGIAATHIGGLTIHSWSGIGIKRNLNKYDLDRISSSEYIVKRVKRSSVLIIDEISMLSAQTLSMIDTVCKEIKADQKPFGGMQIVFVGDFFQLPPVNPVRSSREALKPVLAKTKPHSIPRQAAGRSASNGVNGEKIHIFGIFYRCSTLNFEGITLGGDHDEYKWINFDERDNFDLIFPNCEVIAELEKDWLSRLPAKRMGAGVLFFNEKGELLIVKPHYKDYWSIPGGVVDKNESPRAAAIRETKEEIGIEVNKADFLCVDYISGNDGKGENLQFIFYGGVLNDEQAKQIKADGKEIMEYKFVPKEEALKLLGEGKKLSCSIEQFLEQKEFKPLYLEDGCAFTD